ncbi:MAG: cytidine deaminase [Clostridia bacterium]|nr:cytidine deaminase [Clostridia bacterium]
MEFSELMDKAKGVLNARRLSETGQAGSVAAALLTEKGNVYLGVCIDVTSGMGFCAEHAAIAAMVTAGENSIEKIVAVGTGGIMPPCGRCREFIRQIHDGNICTQVMVADDIVCTIGDLLPYAVKK